MVRAVHLKGKTIKVILEMGLLTEAEIQRLCEICTSAEVDFVKTSTGFNAPGATTEMVRLLRNHLSPKIKVKASGGIRTPQQANDLIEAGADRIGTSAGVAIVGEVSKNA